MEPKNSISIEEVMADLEKAVANDKPMTEKVQDALTEGAVSSCSTGLCGIRKAEDTE